MERDGRDRERQKEGLERSQERPKELSQEQRSFVARSIERCEARRADQTLERPLESKGHGSVQEAPSGGGTPTERFELREERLASLSAQVLNEKSIQQRFEGRGWKELSAKEKAALFGECEKICAGLEGRDRAKLVTKSDKDLAGAHGEYRDGANEIALNEDKVFGPGVSKLEAAQYLFHEQAHANQRDMVGKQEIEQFRPLATRTPNKFEGEMPQARISELSENFRPENRLRGGGRPQEHLSYLGQPVEAHAREVAADRVNRLGKYLDAPE